jgi:hypothetical protein
MMFEVGHPHVPLVDWETFRKNPSPLLIGEVIGRSDNNMFEWFLPLARGAAIASDHLLPRAGYRPGSYRKRGWRKTHCDVFRRDLGPKTLKVRGGIVRDFWTISRWNLDQPGGRHRGETLVYLFGSTPIVTRNYQSAIYLTEYCLANRLSGLHWVSTHPWDQEGAIELAKKCRIDEALLSAPPDLLKAA